MENSSRPLFPVLGMRAVISQVSVLIVLMVRTIEPVEPRPSNASEQRPSVVPIRPSKRIPTLHLFASFDLNMDVGSIAYYSISPRMLNLLAKIHDQLGDVRPRRLPRPP